MQQEESGLPPAPKKPRLGEEALPFTPLDQPLFSSSVAPPSVPSPPQPPTKPTPPKFHTVSIVPDHSDKKVIIKLGKTVSNPKGYRMARASHGVVEGTWYWEAKIEAPQTTNKANQPEPHWRLGWSTGYGNVAGPVGYQTHSYAYRDLDGAKVHEGNRLEYGSPYGPGDVIGFLIHLPSPAPPNIPIPAPILNVFDPPPKIQLDRYEGSFIEFFKNGKSQGRAYEPIYKGKYYPAVSMYYEATVSVNFGPTFECYPQSSVPFEPFSKVAVLDERKFEESVARYNEALAQHNDAITRYNLGVVTGQF